MVKRLWTEYIFSIYGILLIGATTLYAILTVYYYGIDFGYFANLILFASFALFNLYDIIHNIFNGVPWKYIILGLFKKCIITDESISHPMLEWLESDCEKDYYIFKDEHGRKYGIIFYSAE